MRASHAIAVAAVLLVGIGLKLAFFSAAADAGSARSVSLDVSEMPHKIKNLRLEHFHDMTFVFSNGG